jgi:branched-chain amino acid transport system ATP-binding protein
MTEALLSVSGLRKAFGGLVVTDGLDLDIRPGETHAVIGPNGAGKTTLINQLQGDLRPDGGRIRFAGHDITAAAPHHRARIGIARTFQITSVFPQFSVLANIALAVQARLGHSFRFWNPTAFDPTLIAPAEDAMRTVGLLARAHSTAEELSHGERRQLEIAMALAMQPTLLLLDEPMAGMGRQDSMRMTRLLAGLKQDFAILLVEHDMDAVFALADRVTVLVAGRAIASGTPAAIRTDPQVRAAYLGHAQH